MIATKSQPGMFPVATSNNPLTLVHTLPPPGSTTVSAQSMTTLPSTSGLDAIPVIPEASDISALTETQNGKKVYPCTFCDKQFGSRYNASRHEKGCKLAPPGSGGNQPNAEPVLCPNCGKQFQTRDGMTRHLKKKCKVGPTGSVTPSYRWTGKKLHLCKYCGKQFSTKWNAIRHENLFHTSDEPPLTSLMVVPFEQPMAEQQFVQRKPERFCRFCGNYFSTKYNAIRHERICTRISSSTVIPNQNVSTAEAKTTADTSLAQSQITTVNIQSPSTQNVQPTPQPALQQQIVLHQRPQQPNQPPQQQQQQQQTATQQQQNQQQQLTQQLQHVQQVQQLQQQVQRQQQQQQQQQQIQQQPQQHEQQQQIIVQQTQNQLQQMQQQQAIQQHQVGQQQAQPQQVQITSQQVVFVQPFHVCKFCNKQLPTKCDPTPVLREDIQGGTINAAALSSLQVQTPITNTVLTGVSLPMLATIPTHNITIPIQPQTPQQQRTQNQQQIVAAQQTQPQQVQHQQVQLQIQPQQVSTQQIAPQQVQQQNQQVQPQQPPQMQPPPQPQQQHAPQTPQQTQAPPRASPVPSSIQQKPHGCKYCNKHFATKWYLDQHVKIHTGQAVTCDVCQKSFVTRWHLDKHVRVHLPGGKKAKRDSVQSANEPRFNRTSSALSITEIAETSQQNNINGGAEGIVTAMPNFNMASDDRNQLQQFGLSPLTQQDQNDK